MQKVFGGCVLKVMGVPRTAGTFHKKSHLIGRAWYQRDFG
jgi:hypothetical protein